MSLSIAIVPKDKLDWAWPLAKHHVEKAVSYSDGRYTADSVYSIVSLGNAQLWLIVDRKVLAACVTQLSVYPAKLYLTVLFLGGSGFKEWLAPLIASLKRFANNHKATGIEMIGRPGWSRVINKHGFAKSKSICMEWLSGQE